VTRALWKWVGIGAAVLLLFAWAQSCSDAKRQAALDRAARMQAQAAGWYKLYEQQQAHVDTVVQTLRQRDTVLIQRVAARDTIQVPVECEEIFAQDTALIDSLVTQSEGWRSAYEEQLAATVRLRGAYMTLDSAYQTVRKVAVSHSWLPKPKLRPGAFAGVCLGGQMCLGVGMTLSF